MNANLWSGLQEYSLFHCVHFNIYENCNLHVLGHSLTMACSSLAKASKVRATHTNAENVTDQKRFSGMVYKYFAKLLKQQGAYACYMLHVWSLQE